MSVQAGFVVQEHHARRLHWDLRLERDGVLVSWAVPKGLPFSSAERRLAVQTNDHTLAWGRFEGTIPQGRPGGGTVAIWDDGSYRLEKWQQDEIVVVLHGRPDGGLGGVPRRYALVRTDGEGERSTWLLLFTRDQPNADQPPAREGRDLPDRDSRLRGTDAGD